MRCLLNVGGGSKKDLIPAHYAGWRHDLLDIDPVCKPDIVMDARDMTSLPAGTYDAVLCSHNLEHYHRHDGVKVLRGFHHVLKADGLLEIRVPDLEFVFTEVARRKLDIDDVLYQSRFGPILVRDVLYGYHVALEESAQDFYAHKTGFTKKSLLNFVAPLGFPQYAMTNSDPNEIVGFFFKQTPGDEIMQLIGAQRD